MSAILKATNINKIYDEGAVSTQVLTGLVQEKVPCYICLVV